MTQHIALKENLKNWRQIVEKYQKPDSKKATIQILNSFLPFLGLWILMYFSLSWSYLITLALAVVNAFFLVRIFIIQHDCGHQSFLKSRKANTVIGTISSIFSTIPFKSWSSMHNVHHAHNGQLEHRGMGDIFFLTTVEYKNRSNWGKLKYRIFRSSLVQFFIAPIIYLTFSLRYPSYKLKCWNQIKWSHFFNNASIGIILLVLGFTLGWSKFLMVHLPILFIFGVIAFWVFYIQHQHEENYNEYRDEWDYLLASMQGSTYFKLPKLFQWLLGNIGFHHIHHLNSRIPNYHLEACATENPQFNQFVNVLTLQESLKCVHNKLWDETEKRMISFREFKGKLS